MRARPIINTFYERVRRIFCVRQQYYIIIIIIIIVTYFYFYYYYREKNVTVGPLLCSRLEPRRVISHQFSPYIFHLAYLILCTIRHVTRVYVRLIFFQFFSTFFYRYFITARNLNKNEREPILKTRTSLCLVFTYNFGIPMVMGGVMVVVMMVRMKVMQVFISEKMYVYRRGSCGGNPT